ncbi:MAG TPA: hypothetical protein PLZ79_09925 [Burkholderiales bacterium]|nr:hypothetical protein [Burkholderiales bacterium]
MAEPRNWIGSAGVFAVFALGIGYLSASPRYQHLPPEQAMIRLSVSQPGLPLGECRRLSEAELAARAPNMRKPEECPRERAPLSIRLVVDGAVIYQDTIRPSGWRRDGSSAIYLRLPVIAGTHRIEAAVNDDATVAGFAFMREAEVTLEPGQLLTIDFDRSRGGVLFL